MKPRIWQCAMVAGIIAASMSAATRGEETREQAAARQQREQEDRINALRAQLPQPPGVVKGSDNPGDPRAPMDPRGPIDSGYRPASEGPTGQPDPAPHPRRPAPPQPPDDSSAAPPAQPPRFRSAHPGTPAGAPRGSDVGDLFRGLDLNGDGVLSLQEFRRLFDSPVPSVSSAEGSGDSPAAKPEGSRDGGGDGRVKGGDAPRRDAPAAAPTARPAPSDAPPASWKDDPQEPPSKSDLPARPRK